MVMENIENLSVKEKKKKKEKKEKDLGDVQVRWHLGHEGFQDMLDINWF